MTMNNAIFKKTRYYYITVVLLFLLATTRFCATEASSSSSAWIPPLAAVRDNYRLSTSTTRQRRFGGRQLGAASASGGDDDDNVGGSESLPRRTWLSQVITTAAATVTSVVLTTPCRPAQAVTTATVVTTTKAEKPTSGAVCDTAVSVMAQPETGRRVYILGTAHISNQSADVAGQLVRDVKPNAVFVELDAKRVGRAGPIASSSAGGDNVPSVAVISPTGVPDTTTVQQQQQVPSTIPETSSSSSGSSTKSLFPKLDIRQRALQFGSVAVGNAIQGMYKRLNSSGFNAGQEFVVAVREGQKVGSAIVLGDRDVEVTLRRLTEALAQTDLSALMNPDSDLEKSMSELLPSSSSVAGAGRQQQPPNLRTMDDAEFQQEMSTYVETMKARDNVRKIMGELKKAAPQIYQALVEERDVYMGTGLHSLNQFTTIVAVMGIAHMEGVERRLQDLGWRHVPIKCPTRG